jgi:hypothetical protein
LFLASPEVVFEELKKLSAKADPFGRDGRLESALVKRNQPLINLGLASYGANKEVCAALYKRALKPQKMRLTPYTKKDSALDSSRTRHYRRRISSPISHKTLSGLRRLGGLSSREATPR